jgi:peptide/nickel transport system substrate-binding protein
MTRPSRSRRRRFATALAGGLLLVGCSAGAGDSAAASSTLRYAAVGTPATATNDPHGGFANESDLVRFALTYDALTVPGEDGETRPRLATSRSPTAGRSAPSTSSTPCSASTTRQRRTSAGWRCSTSTPRG